MIKFLKKKVKSNKFISACSRKLYGILPVMEKEAMARKSNYAYSKLESDNGFIFIHIPKCAGNAIINSLFFSRPTGHVCISEYYWEDRERFSSSYKFTIVRNPITRFISAYDYLVKGGMVTYDVEFRDKYLKKFDDINEFISALGSKKFRKKILNWTHFIPQHKFILIGGEIYLDDIYKQEELDANFNRIVERLGVRSECRLKYINTTNGDKDRLSEKSLSFLRELYKYDFELLDYED